MNQCRIRYGTFLSENIVKADFKAIDLTINMW